MTDDELIDRFERAALPGEAFTHEAQAWADFARRNPDLLQSGLAPLAPWYPDVVLRSERARWTFVLPTATAYKAR